MISYVRGVVAATGPDTAVVEVGGVGLALLCTPATIAGLRVGEPAHLAAALVVREDSLTLFGFADEDERTVFEILQTVTGVGPRLAQAALAVHPPDELRRAVAEDDLVSLTKVPGIGRKGAQRIVLELKDRLGPPTGHPTAVRTAASAPAWADQVHSGLLALGWSAKEAASAVDEVRPLAEEAGETDVAVLLRAALRSLDRS